MYMCEQLAQNRYVEVERLGVESLDCKPAH